MEETQINPGPSFGEFLRGFEKKLGFKNEIKWNRLFFFVAYHVLAVYWCYEYAFPAKWQTLIFGKLQFFVIILYFFVFCKNVKLTLHVY